MRGALAGLALLAAVGVTPAEARKRHEPMYDCGQEVSEPNRSWKVWDSSLPDGYWKLSNPSGPRIMSFQWLHSQQELDSYLAGQFKPGQGASVHVSPWRSIPKEGAWFTMRGNGTSVGPVHYGHHQHGSSSVVIKGETFFQMAAGAEDAVVIVQAQDGTTLHKLTISAASVREMEAGLLPLIKRVVAAQQEPEKCGEVIIMTH